MNDEPPVLPAPRPSRQSRRWIVSTIVLVLGAVGWKYIGLEGWRDFQHSSDLRRITAHTTRVIDRGRTSSAVERMTKPERGCYEIARTIQTALGNSPFVYRQRTVPGKIHAIAERLDATNGADFKTFEGCVELLKLFDGASPSFHEYSWVDTLYELSADGTIPPLPELGKQWKETGTPKI
ncbi:MAG: hypothetical protein ABUL68_00875 [Pseudomonadota bacterium]